jgi:hypothetical protein
MTDLATVFSDHPTPPTYLTPDSLRDTKEETGSEKGHGMPRVTQHMRDFLTHSLAVPIFPILPPSCEGKDPVYSLGLSKCFYSNGTKLLSSKVGYPDSICPEQAQSSN